MFLVLAKSLFLCDSIVCSGMNDVCVQETLICYERSTVPIPVESSQLHVVCLLVCAPYVSDCLALIMSLGACF